MQQRIKGVTIGIGVHNSVQALEWYKTLLGDIEVMEPVSGVFEIKLTDTTWLQFDDTGYMNVGGGSAIVRLETEDIRTAHALSKTVASEVGDIVEIEGVVKYFDLTDPSGNRLSFVQVEG